MTNYANIEKQNKENNKKLLHATDKVSTKYKKRQSKLTKNDRHLLEEFKKSIIEYNCTIISSDSKQLFDDIKNKFEALTMVGLKNEISKELQIAFDNDFESLTKDKLIKTCWKFLHYWSPNNNKFSEELNKLLAPLSPVVLDKKK